MTADFGIAANADPERRWFSRELGGSALLDVGIYPVTLAVSVLGTPEAITAVGALAETRVDAQVAATMRHLGGLSSVVCSLIADSGVEATVAGVDGSLRLHADFHRSPRLSVRRRAEVVRTIDVPGYELGWRYEVREIHRCLADDLLESPRLPHALTLDVLGVLDEIRDQVGVAYPFPEPRR